MILIFIPIIIIFIITATLSAATALPEVCGSTGTGKLHGNTLAYYPDLVTLVGVSDVGSFCGNIDVGAFKHNLTVVANTTTLNTTVIVEYLVDQLPLISLSIKVGFQFLVG